ncbi:MAG TPA: MmgE/PrpD family protein [Methylomirabilota bacterium]|jgi:2-methylcitrate dehydratase PrpD|nr:MmgE/PrpD family protein [Methylomirabilota bacterium]
MEIPLTRQLASFCQDLHYRTLSPKVVDRAKYFFLDYLAVAVRGSLSDSSQPLYRIAAALGAGQGSTVLGRGEKAAFPYAALANGTAAHSIELDDTHQGGSIHLGVSVFSAALAVAEQVDANGQEFLAAVVAGFEVAARLAMALRPKEHYGQGFHPTATCGTFGAAAAAAKLLDLKEEQLLSALGIAGSQAAGLMEFLTDGAWTKRLHPGWAAFSGIHAALLAREGFIGPTTIIEGKAGFLKAYSPRSDPKKITDGLGVDFQILRTAVKPHACCRYTQAPIDATLLVAQEHNIQPHEVQAITVGMLETGIPVICEPAERKRQPLSVVDMQFSLPFGVAVALAKRRAGLAEFTLDMLNDPEVRALMPKVGYARDPELEKNYPQEWPAWVRICLNDGREVSAQVRFPKGDPENPLSWDELIEKYRGLAGVVWPKQKVDTLQHAVRRLERENSLRNFAALL